MTADGRKGSILDKKNAFVRRHELEQVLSAFDKGLMARERRVAEHEARRAAYPVHESAMNYIAVAVIVLLAVIVLVAAVVVGVVP